MHQEDPAPRAIELSSHAVGTRDLKALISLLQHMLGEHLVETVG